MQRLLLTFVVLLGVALAYPSAAGAYMHAENCKAGLRGGNGDDDVAAYRAANGGPYFAGFGSSTHPYGDPNRVIVGTQFNFRWGILYNQGYCVGNDLDFSDKVDSPPAGWY